MVGWFNDKETRVCGRLSKPTSECRDPPWKMRPKPTEQRASPSVDCRFWNALILITNRRAATKPRVSQPSHEEFVAYRDDFVIRDNIYINTYRPKRSRNIRESRLRGTCLFRIPYLFAPLYYRTFKNVRATVIAGSLFDGSLLIPPIRAHTHTRTHITHRMCVYVIYRSAGRVRGGRGVCNRITAYER